MSMVFCRACGTQLHETAASCTKCGAQQSMVGKPSTVKSQTIAVFLSAFLGAIGIHRFYLRKYVTGVFYVLLCWTGLPGLLAFVETVMIAFMSPEKWAEKYNGGTPSAPINVAVKWVLGAIIPVIFVTGIIAAVAIPAYRDYTERARASQSSNEVSARVEEQQAAIRRAVTSQPTTTATTTKPAGDVSGTYRTDWSELQIIKVTPNRIKFQINATAGMNASMVMGEVQLNGDNAFYANADQDCKLSFKFISGAVAVSQEGTCDMGLNASAEGNYQRVGT